MSLLDDAAREYREAEAEYKHRFEECREAEATWQAATLKAKRAHDRMVSAGDWLIDAARSAEPTPGKETEGR